MDLELCLCFIGSENGVMIQGRIESRGQEMDFLNDIEQGHHQF